MTWATPDLPITGTPVETAWGEDVVACVAELAPDSAGAVPYANATADGYEQLAPSAQKFLRFNDAGTALEAVEMKIPMLPMISALQYLADQLQGHQVPTTNNVYGSAPGTANRARFMPFIVTETVTLKRLAVRNGAAVAGNFKLGIYSSSADGKPDALLGATGSTAQSGTHTIQGVNLASPLELTPGLYFAVHVPDTGSGSEFWQISAQIDPTNVQLDSKVMGVFYQNSAFTLPATATPVFPDTSVQAVDVTAYRFTV